MLVPMLPSRLLIVRQNFPDLRLTDVRGEARRTLDQSGFAERLTPGARVAIGVGSRGIANIATIVNAVVGYWRARGMSPFIFPCMGSHGAATAEGQAHVLEGFGITERTMGCPIVSGADVVSLGSSEDSRSLDVANHQIADRPGLKRRFPLRLRANRGATLQKVPDHLVEHVRDGYQLGPRG